MEAIVRAATALFLNQEVRITYWSVVILLMLPRSHAWPEPSLSSTWSRSGSARRVAWLPCDVNVTRTPPLDITDSWTASLPSWSPSDQLDMFSASPVFRLIMQVGTVAVCTGECAHRCCAIKSEAAVACSLELRDYTQLQTPAPQEDLPSTYWTGGCALEKPMKAQRGSRCIALLFL
jgi:hypothetical protein